MGQKGSKTVHVRPVVLVWAQVTCLCYHIIVYDCYAF